MDESQIGSSSRVIFLGDRVYPLDLAKLVQESNEGIIFLIVFDDTFLLGCI